MVEITFYGGAGEIGGNMILVRDKDSKILLDFGMSLGERGRFFSEPFLSPRNESGLISLGIIRCCWPVQRRGGSACGRRLS